MQADPHPDYHSDHPLWLRNVGPPVALDLAPPATLPLTGVDVLSWNLAIGAARLPELLTTLRDSGIGADPERPLVILAQEAFRSGEQVPPELHGLHHGGKPRGPGRCDIVATARDLGLSLRYAPSMRNGRSRSDRGNAILATAALTNAHAFHLPYVRQRRVAVAVALEGVPETLFASAHLDTRGMPGGRTFGRFGAGRALQAASLGKRLAADAGDRIAIVGADLNTPLGRRDPALRALESTGFRRLEFQSPVTHTFHGPVRLLLDHLLVRGTLADTVRLRRLDETPSDRARHVFGSDHHPLLLSIDFQDGGERDVE